MGPLSLCQCLKAVWRQDIEDHFICDGFFYLAAKVVSAGTEFLLALRAHNLDDAALDDVRAVAFNKAVYHAGASDQPNLADGEWKKWAFGTAVQLAAAHHLREAVRLAKLLLQFLLVEPLAHPLLQNTDEIHRA